MAESPVQMNLVPTEATSESFAEYGQVIEASSDGDLFGPNDAQLDLSRGTPRYSLSDLYRINLCLVIFVSNGCVD